MQPSSFCSPYKLKALNIPENFYCPSTNGIQLFPYACKVFLFLAEYERARDKKTIIPAWINKKKETATVCEQWTVKINTEECRNYRFITVSLQQ